jgi:hypothetical protein
VAPDVAAVSLHFLIAEAHSRRSRERSTTIPASQCLHQQPPFSADRASPVANRLRVRGSCRTRVAKWPMGTAWFSVLVATRARDHRRNAAGLEFASPLELSRTLSAPASAAPGRQDAGRRPSGGRDERANGTDVANGTAAVAEITSHLAHTAGSVRGGMGDRDRAPSPRRLRRTAPGDHRFDWLVESYPGKFQPGQVRTLQRRVRDWRARHRPDQEQAPVL